MRLFSLFTIALFGLSVVFGGAGFPVHAQETNEKPAAETEAPEAPENPFPDRPKAPSLEGGVGWLNTSGEIAMPDLRGKVVLLDFWTYCCINCMHVLPDLEYLEKKYGNELVVIGVHSAKFDNEQETENIREAIVRYEIAHPVINDANMTVWRKFGVRAWPTVVLIDPEGNYCGYLSGEGNREILDQVIGDLVDYHKFKGTLDQTPVDFALEKEKQKPTPLKYPGKVLTDPENDRLYISDSNHNRIVVTTLVGKLVEVIGDGQIGFTDGNYQTAQFDHPQGMELVDGILYVADTENHAIRTIDLNKKQVATLAGLGEQARIRVSGGPLKTTALNSPWALCHVDGTLYIAMAGPHQIWSHELGSQRIGVFSGTGSEDITDGPHDASAYAQTSGMTTDGKFIYVCDSEGSSIRKIDTDPEGKVTTVVGTHDLPRGRSLFEFGDVDAVGEEARLQHPLGVVYRDGMLFVADTYNHKIKQVDLKTRQLSSWLGDGKRGQSREPVRFSEPSGLALAGKKLFIADTNNHRILVADIETKAVEELELAGLEPPAPPQPKTSGIQAQEVFAVEAQSLKPGPKIPVNVQISLPEGFKLNPLVPVTYRVNVEGKQGLVPAAALGSREEATVTEEGVVKCSVPLQSDSGKATLLLTLSYNYCRDGKSGVCKIGITTWKIPVTLAETGASDLKLSATVK
ncbi:MAG: redoxin domain-containing protein [Planctomycetaceae bacterium]|nr:redoxin domain-containing protein [Planctomycetaceae bacterium]